jgi:hypothetical protein
MVVAEAPPVGKVLACPKCRQPFRVAAPGPAHVPSAAPPASSSSSAPVLSSQTPNGQAGPVSFACPQCRVPLRLASPPAPGQTVRCPQCKATFSLPAPAPAPPRPKQTRLALPPAAEKKKTQLAQERPRTRLAGAAARPVRFRCPACQALLQANRQPPPGLEMKCPQCGKAFRVRRAEPPPRPAVRKTKLAPPAPPPLSRKLPPQVPKTQLPPAAKKTRLAGPPQAKKTQQGLPQPRSGPPPARPTQVPAPAKPTQLPPQARKPAAPGPKPAPGASRPPGPVSPARKPSAPPTAKGPPATPKPAVRPGGKPIRVRCPACRTNLRLTRRFARGQRFKCPRCSKTLVFGSTGDTLVLKKPKLPPAPPRAPAPKPRAAAPQPPVAASRPAPAKPAEMPKPRPPAAPTQVSAPTSRDGALRSAKAVDPGPPSAPKPASRPLWSRPWLWLVLAVGVVALFLAADYLYLGLLFEHRIPESAWRPFSPANGRCRLEMPGNPDVKRFPNLPGTTYYKVERKKEAAVFFLSISDQSADPARPPSLVHVYADVRKRISEIPQYEGGTIVREADLSRAGHAGKEFQLQARDGGLLTVRVFLVRGKKSDRIYVLMAGGHPLDAARFFDSFQILPELSQHGRTFPLGSCRGPCPRFHPLIVPHRFEGEEPWFAVQARGRDSPGWNCSSCWQSSPSASRLLCRHCSRLPYPLSAPARHSG